PANFLMTSSEGIRLPRSRRLTCVRWRVALSASASWPRPSARRLRLIRLPNCAWSVSTIVRDPRVPCSEAADTLWDNRQNDDTVLTVSVLSASSQLCTVGSPSRSSRSPAPRQEGRRAHLVSLPSVQEPHQCPGRGRVENGDLPQLQGLGHRP